MDSLEKEHFLLKVTYGTCQVVNWQTKADMFTCGVFRRLFTNRFDQRQLVFVTFYGEIKRNSSILCSEVRHAASLVLGGGDPVGVHDW